MIKAVMRQLNGDDDHSEWAEQQMRIIRGIHDNMIHRFNKVRFKIKYLNFHRLYFDESFTIGR